MTNNSEDKALREFKLIMSDLLRLLVKSSGAKTGYMYWVNRSRRQFVLESSHTQMQNVMFKDRIEFEDFFLDQYKNTKRDVQLVVGESINSSRLRHYYEKASVEFIRLIPFQNNGETVAITVLESDKKLNGMDLDDVINSYNRAHINVLNTYLKLTDMFEDQARWEGYDRSLDSFNKNLTHVQVLDHLLNEVQRLLPTGGCSIVLRGMETWVSVLRSEKSNDSPSLGLMVEERSMAYDALQKGEPVFSMHFNQNPKRISTSENETEGATLAIPVLISGRRQSVLLVYDKNPLVFTESVKHQLKNLVRVAGLSIRAKMGKKRITDDLFTSEYGNFKPDLWKLSLEKQTGRNNESNEHVWFGLIGIDNLSEIRSQYRLDDLVKLQRIIVKAINPSRLGYNGIIGFHSDYVYSYIFVGMAEEHHKQWLKTNILDLKNKIELGDGRKIPVSINAGSTKLANNDRDIDEIINDAKQSLNVAMNSEREYSIRN
jgi:hypothetical protein